MAQAQYRGLPGVALVTGAAAGIGHACAKVFIEEGVTRLILSDINYEALVESVKELKSLNPAVETCLVKCDTSSEEQVENMVAEGVKKFGAIHYCVNNAGVTSRVRTKTHLLETEEWDRVQEVNLRGVWLCQRAELRQMMKQEADLPMRTGAPPQRGAIVNISSLFGLISHPTVGAYSAAKTGVLGITRTDAVAYAEDGIRVNSVLPGFIKTALTQESIKRGANYNALINTIPMNRWGLPTEVAQAVVFLCSDRASLITGEQLSVSGAKEYAC
ncbi:uncharacterized protein A1O5_09194 [Cladophialophora psammophila CBS 110553]|uniref:3-oxoacyl-[acyl-carrier protein] reductase n=1 Tax=Cladophialophora psammophila CBS 110553 TaxID=1182543 RepID=W9WIX6_9EURO|nr:uncharacterized protein A1O5_09194 [Cladophialophora psammophila CBS 110553]EXJ67848.1 hypothetical protein A1O5_09194 [Cladophialophora psammophila CBS 110553]